MLPGHKDIERSFFLFKERSLVAKKCLEAKGRGHQWNSLVSLPFLSDILNPVVWIIAGKAFRIFSYNVTYVSRSFRAAKFLKEFLPISTQHMSLFLLQQNLHCSYNKAQKGE